VAESLAKTNPELGRVKLAAISSNNLWFDVNVENWSDKKTRHALSMAIDSEVIAYCFDELVKSDREKRYVQQSG